jgi:hypothetical protein
MYIYIYMIYLHSSKLCNYRMNVDTLISSLTNSRCLGWGGFAVFQQNCANIQYERNVKLNKVTWATCPPSDMLFRDNRSIIN